MDHGEAAANAANLAMLAMLLPTPAGDAEGSMTPMQWLEANPAVVARYLRRRMVPYEYVRLVEWLRVRAPFNHTRSQHAS